MTTDKDSYTVLAPRRPFTSPPFLTSSFFPSLVLSMEFQSKDLREFKKTRVVKSSSIPLQCIFQFQWNFNGNEVRNISINAECFQYDLNCKIIENSYNLLWKLSEEFCMSLYQDQSSAGPRHTGGPRSGSGEGGGETHLWHDSNRRRLPRGSQSNHALNIRAIDDIITASLKHEVQ